MIKKYFLWNFLCVFLWTALPGRATADFPDFTGIVKSQGAAVVNISTTKYVKREGVSPFDFGMDENDPMFDLFRRFFPGGPGGGPNNQRRPNEPQTFQTHSLGSGFIVSKDGYVLTNAHVVSGADEIIVKLTDRREFKAKIIGSDKRTDVALVKIIADNLPTVRLGDSTKLQVGEWALAIGAPFGFENSATAGIVSALGRSLPDDSYVPFIQTDVAINPGNSGGPLFNLKGEVVGMNSQIYSNSGSYAGISFAIPIEVAMKVSDQLKSFGKVRRGRAGVRIQPVTKELAESFGLDSTQGVLIGDIEEQSPAARAGLTAGDIILKVDGKPITSVEQLVRLIGDIAPGSHVTLQVWRKKTTRNVELTVGEMPSDERASNAGEENEGKPNNSPLGLSLRELTAEQKKSLNLKYGLRVENASSAETQGMLRPGDILLELVNRGEEIPLTSVSQFEKQVGRVKPGSPITLLVQRGSEQLYLSLTLPKK